MIAVFQRLLFCILFFGLLGTGYAQDTITVTLMVDTQNFNPDDLNDSCSFKAVWSDSGKVVTSTGDLEGFEFGAFVEDTIVWEGVSTSSDSDLIDIKKVVRENDSKIFKDKRNNGQRRGSSNKETVQAKILYSTVGKPDYKYKIYFKINQSGKTHKIDPKIKVGTK